jgi:hypothetical protein
LGPHKKRWRKSRVNKKEKKRVNKEDKEKVKEGTHIGVNKEDKEKVKEGTHIGVNKEDKEKGLCGSKPVSGFAPTKVIVVDGEKVKNGRF